MKKYLILLPALLVCYTLSAQLTVGIDGGLSIPTGQYAGTASTSGNTLNGYAKIGSCYDAYVGFKFLPFIGAMVQYGANNNSFDVAKLNTSGTSTFTTSGGDKIAEYLIGPYFSIKLANIKLEAKLLGGIVSSNYPTITDNTSFNGVTSSVSNSFDTGNDFGFCAGAKIKFMVARIVGIGLGVDYLASSVSFQGVGNGNTYKMSEGVIQATLGVSLDL
ncbi:MAG TPA: hypothetical protein VK808_02820 [Bacteroidia bacterium]|nr:hypothetical protein [Bacteroidia bacterium]